MVLVRRQALAYFLPEEHVGQRAFEVGDWAPYQRVVSETQMSRRRTVGHPDFECPSINKKQHLVAMFKQELVVFLAHEVAGPE